jgi:uncharacterized ubiquitin-like protein YukD
MFITITLKTSGGQADIRIDSEQRISVALEVLRDSGKLRCSETPTYYRSQLGEKLVSAYKTFQEEQVYDGDILCSIE